MTQPNPLRPHARAAARRSYSLIVLLALLAWPGIAQAAGPGTLDGGFGSGGIALAGGATRLFGDAVQSDGRVIAVGEGRAGSSADLLVERFTASGRLDPSFGSGGVATGPAIAGAPGAGSLGRAAAVQADGKIVVVGKATDSTGVSQDGLLVERFNANGSLDSTFGSHGVVNLLSSALGDGYAVVVQPDGKIVATGSANAFGSGGGSFPRATLVRLNANGSLDGGFGSGGIDVLDFGPFSYALAVARQADGKLVMAGSQAPGLQASNALIARLTTSGARDGSFAGGGAFAHQYAQGAASSSFNAVAVQGDGKIVAAGAAADGNTAAEKLVVRFSAAGGQDPSFGSGGVVYSLSALNGFSTAAGLPGASSLVVAGNGDIVTAGTIANGTVVSAAASALTSGGAADHTFGSGGSAVLPGGGGQNTEYAGLAIAPDGKLVAVGDEKPILGGSFTGFAVRYIGLPGGGGGGGTPPLKIQLSHLSSSFKTSSIKKHGLPITVTCNESCQITATVSVSAATAKKLHLKTHGKGNVTLLVVHGSLTKSGKKSITLKFSKSLIKALGGQKQVGLTLQLSVTSTATHKTQSVKKGLTFKR